MRLQQMLFVAFSSTVLLIGCSKPAQFTSTENQTLIHMVYQIENDCSDTKVDLSNSLFHNLSNMMMQNDLSYTDQVVYFQNTRFSDLVERTPIWFYSIIKELKMTPVLSSLDSPNFLTPTSLTKKNFELIYQKIKVMINGERTILNC